MYRAAIFLLGLESLSVCNYRYILTTDIPMQLPSDIIDRLARIEEHVQESTRKIDSLIHVIDGNGFPGFRLRLDRLEQLEARRRWYHHTAIGAAIVSLVSAALVVVRKLMT